MLNKIWPLFIIVSFAYAIINGKVNELNNSIFESAESSVELCITFLGTMCLWNGIIKIVEKTSLMEKFKKIISPFMKLLFPDIKKESKAYGQISMNIIANILGLGNAATPIGIKAMESMQEVNKSKDTLSNSMIMFIVINTASLQIIPTTVIAIRTSLNSKNPSLIILPVWFATVSAALSAIVITKILSKKRSRRYKMKIINYISIIAIPMVILVIVLIGVTEKKKVYDIFIDGVKEGMHIVVNIFPTLLGLFVAIGALRSSGILDLITNIFSPIVQYIGMPSEIIPLAFIRPISGSASMAVATDIMNNYGVDSKIGLIASTIMGSTETTFYTIAIYTASVKIKNTRFVLIAALAGDFVGILTSVVIWRFMS